MWLRSSEYIVIFSNGSGKLHVSLLITHKSNTQIENAEGSKWLVGCLLEKLVSKLAQLCLTGGIRLGQVNGSLLNSKPWNFPLQLAYSGLLGKSEKF